MVKDTVERHRITVAVREVLNGYPQDRIFTARDVAEQTGENIRQVSAILMSERMCKRIGKVATLRNWANNRKGKKWINQYRRI